MSELILNKKRAKELAFKLRHAVMSAPIDMDDDEAMAVPLASALAQVEAETWEKVANEIRLIISQGPLKTDWNLMELWCRQQAQRAKEENNGR